MLQREWRVQQQYASDRLTYQMSTRANSFASRITDDLGNAVNTGYFGTQQRAVYYEHLSG